MTCLNQVPLDLARATVPVWHVENIRLLSPFQRKMARMQRKLQQKWKDRLDAQAH